MRRFRRQVLHREVTLPHRVVSGRRHSGGLFLRPASGGSAQDAPDASGRMQAGRRIAPLRCSKQPSPPGGTGRSGSPGGSPAPRRQAGNSRHAPLQAESQPPRISRSNMSPAPGRNASRFCTPPRHAVFQRVPPPSGKKSSAARRPEPGQIPRGGKHFPAQPASESVFLPRPGSCAHTTTPHALRDNNMRRRAPLAFSPSASFSGHAPLPRALFFHRARRRTRPFFIYKHPG